MIKKILLLPVSVLVLSYSVSAQRYSREAPQEALERGNRPFYGAYLNLLVGDYTNIGVSPFAGYSITRTTEIGAGPFYQYTFISRNGFSSYGGRVFLRQAVYKQFFAQAEYEYMDTREVDLDAPDQGRIAVNSLLFGAGYYGGIGGRVRMHMTALFNVLDNDYKPYNQPMIRIGFSRSF